MVVETDLWCETEYVDEIDKRIVVIQQFVTQYQRHLLITNNHLLVSVTHTHTHTHVSVSDNFLCSHQLSISWTLAYSCTAHPSCNYSHLSQWSSLHTPLSVPSASKVSFVTNTIQYRLNFLHASIYLTFSPHRQHCRQCMLDADYSSCVCLSVCWSHGWAPQKRLNRSRCRLGENSHGRNEPGSGTL